MASLSKRLLQIHFLIWKSFYFDSNFSEIRSQEPIKQKAGIGLDKALVPNMQQAIIWNNSGVVLASLDLK